MTVDVALLGFPRIGAHRELKFALERHWSGELSESELSIAVKRLRRANWALESARGATVLPTNDFSLYDHVLDTSSMLEARTAGTSDWTPTSRPLGGSPAAAAPQHCNRRR